MTYHAQEVAIGVLRNAESCVLVSKRKSGSNFTDCWELPGGKRKSDETNEVALVRELKEELGIDVSRFRPLIKIRNDSSTPQVDLHVFEILDWFGKVIPREGQEIRWISKKSFSGLKFPQGNTGINSALFLPALVLVTPTLSGDINHYVDEIFRLINSGIKLVHIRPLINCDKALRELTNMLANRVSSSDIQIMINGKVSFFDEQIFQGLHLNSFEASLINSRPVSASKLFSTSCHNFHELEHAQKIGVDFVFISPVRNTSTHPDVSPLGWYDLRRLVQRAVVPVYALGGLSCRDITSAREIGCQGIAMKNTLWNASDPGVLVNRCHDGLARLERYL